LFIDIKIFFFCCCCCHGLTIRTRSRRTSRKGGGYPPPLPRPNESPSRDRHDTGPRSGPSLHDTPRIEIGSRPPLAFQKAVPSTAQTKTTTGTILSEGVIVHQKRTVTFVFRRTKKKKVTNMAFPMLCLSFSFCKMVLFHGIFSFDRTSLAIHLSCLFFVFLEYTCSGTSLGSPQTGVLPKKKKKYNPNV
jgi:hypothetical protein